MIRLISVSILIILSEPVSADEIRNFAQQVIRTGRQISKAGTDDAPHNQYKVSKCNDKGIFYAVVNTESNGSLVDSLVDMRIKCGHDVWLYNFAAGTVENGSYNQGQYNFQECLKAIGN